MLTIRLYTKEGCSLCEEVKQELAGLQASYLHHLTEIDITQDTAVFQKYRSIIPVVQIAAMELQAPISRQQLESALQAMMAGN